MQTYLQEERELLNNEMEWVYPREIEDVYNLIMKHRYNKICLVDDIDCDGLSSLIIIYRLLTRMECNVSIRYNTKHGITAQELHNFSEFDLVILLDSSTNECQDYGSFKGEIIVIDHHNIQEGLVPSSNVLLCNSKNTNKLENISAGFLSYTIAKYIGERQGINTDDLLSYGVMSIYSDIVPVDDYISKALYYSLGKTHDTDLVRYSKFSNVLTRSSYQMDIVPKFNYTRRLNDLTTIDRVVALGYTDTIYEKLVCNRKRAKSIVDMLSMSKMVSSLYEGGKETLRYLDITGSKDILCSVPITNFKGLLSNKEKDNYNLNTVICGVDLDNERVAISIRSSAEVLNNALPYMENGGGHLKACGGIILKSNLSDMLKNVAKLKPVDDVNVKDMNWEDLEHEMLMEYAMHNELAFSNITPKEIRLPYTNLFEMPTIEHTVNGIKVKRFKQIPVDKPIVLTPTVTGTMSGELGLSLIVKN